MNSADESLGNDCDSEQGKELQENETPTLPKPQQIQSDHAKFLECEFCKKTFKLNGKLKIHLKSNKCQKQNQTSSKRTEPNMEDSIENAIDRSKDEFIKPKPAKIARVRVGNEAKKLNYQCHKCTKTFEEKDGIIEHVTFQHSKINCDVCGKIFDESLALKKHYSDEHLTENILCDKCDKVFFTKEVLKEHQFMAHEDVKCGKCDKTFSNQKLREHVENRVSCKTCKIKLCNDDLLANHTKLHKSYKCEICLKAFNYESGLLYHKFSHERENKCDSCHETFNSPKRLQDHVKCNHISL